MFPFKPLIFGMGAFLAVFATGCSSRPPDGKIHVTYWEKWSGQEEYAMQQVVDQFNHSQDRIVVDFLSLGDVQEKTLLSTAAGNPPDISGIWLGSISSLVDRGTLTPLDDFMRADGSSPGQFLSRYAPAYADMGSYKGRIWAVPSTPTASALYWNKDAFRAAGLDPDRPPRTEAELESMSAKLTVYDAAGNLKQVGFLPQVSGYWIWAFPQWFGGELFDGKNVTIGTDPANLKAFQWLAGFSKLYGVEHVRRLTSTFGRLSTPQDPFMSGQVAIIFDGVWRNNYIEQFAPGMDYGVAGWPQARPGIDDFTAVDSDVLVIPRGAKHPREAWAFLRYISSPNLSAQRFEDLRGLELLCYLQKKASPLEQWSPFFEAHHPNPDIKVFRQLGESHHAVHPPSIGIWDEYARELDTAFDEIRLGIESPGKALQVCQARLQNSWDWHRESLALREKATASASSNPPTSSSP
ncbi:MAG: ABC transporter substrate-binding protein [Methylacidiphilales bacterium]|nr:ABC transporter substrate-binding protein [Candidatus Methylacidiphilales bacterium]